MTKENARNDKKVLGRPCDLTLFWLSPKHPSPCEGEGQEGEVCCPHPVMLSAAKHPCCGFLALARNDKKEHLE